jgi:hypothetical protein
MMKKTSISRRNFLGKAATAGVAGAVLPTIITGCSSEPKKVVAIQIFSIRLLTDRCSKPVLSVVADAGPELLSIS